MTLLQPIGDRAIVQPIEAEEVRASGLVLPAQAVEQPNRARVIAVGAGRWENGSCVPLTIAEGDEVIYSRYGGTEVKLDGEEYLVLRESDILAIVREDA